VIDAYRWGDTWTWGRPFRIDDYLRSQPLDERPIEGIVDRALNFHETPGRAQCSEVTR